MAFQHAKEFLRPRIESEKIEGATKKYKKPRFRVVDNSQQKEITDEVTGAKLVLIGSDSDLAHGLAPSFVLADEPAKWKSGGRKMYNALRTGMGKQVDAKFVALGTKPEEDDHWFREMLENPSKHTYIQKHETSRDDPDFSMRVVRKANPSYDHIGSLRQAIQEEMEDAKKGINLAAWRAYRLNQGTSEDDEKEMLVLMDDWKATLVLEAPPREGPVFVGIDIGGGVSMTAIAFYWPMTGRHEVYACFPATPSLLVRGKDDNVGHGM